MKTRRIFQLGMLLILALVVLTGLTGLATSVGAADPWLWEQGLPWSTATPWPTPYILCIGEHFSFGFSIVPATPTPIPVPFGVPTARLSPAVSAHDGDSPMNALLPDGAAHTLAAGASVWYKVGSGGEHIDVFLNVNLLSGMSLTVFAPGNLSDPIGQGTLQASTGRLVWSGGHWQSEGDWLARVTNSNSMAVQYTLTSSTYEIGKKSCSGYWEYLPNGQYIYWNECR